MAYNPKCEACGSHDRVAIFYTFDPWDTEFLCWPCRKPLIYDRVFPERDDVGDSEPSSAGQALLTDW